MCGRNALMKCNRIAWRFFATKPIVRCFPSYSNAAQLNITPWRSGSKCLNLDFSNLSPSMPCFRMNMPIHRGSLQPSLPAKPRSFDTKTRKLGPYPQCLQSRKSLTVPNTTTPTQPWRTCGVPDLRLRFLAILRKPGRDAVHVLFLFKPVAARRGLDAHVFRNSKCRSLNNCLTLPNLKHLRTAS